MYSAAVMPAPDVIPNTTIMPAATVTPEDADMTPAQTYVFGVASQGEMSGTSEVLPGETSFIIETPLQVEHP